MLIHATAATFHRDTRTWELHARDFTYRGRNRTRAINWALAKIEREFPGHTEYSAEIE